MVICPHDPMMSCYTVIKFSSYGNRDSGIPLEQVVALHFKLQDYEAEAIYAINLSG